MENKKTKKTTYKGVLLDVNTGKYLVATTFITKDGFRIKKMKRGFETAKKAELWKNQQALEISNTVYGTGKLNKHSLEYLLNQYLDFKSHSVKYGSIKQIKHYLTKHFLFFFGNFAVSDITSKQVIDYYSYISGLSVKNQTKNLIIVHSLGFVEWLNLMEILENSIYKKFKLILVKFEIIEKPKNDFLELDEFKLFISSFGNTRDDKMFALAFNTLFYSGIRKGELLALQYKDIDYESHCISITKQAQYVAEKQKSFLQIGKTIILPYTKTNTTKCIELPFWVIEYFEELQQLDNATDEDFIFKYNNRIIVPSTLQSTLDKHLKMVGLRHVKVHDFRHSNTTLLYDLGADSKFVQERLGHSSPKTSLEIYNHLTSKRKQKNSDLIKNMS